ncbi:MULTISPECIES: ACP S-malonyltransferase [unclassified Facklamia]|uniref:ACP S-malonyltransferase n=1 Tax=Aerococcaceae TaxID=186827 RepID=UPI0013B986C3|nr:MULTISPECIES: ACP S-malonyltransferase [unclassified Facklamia]NEW64330.1 acyltransferase domain-containing protein [Facklamia sp. 252]NEW67833.1 acyltransferase domain-containing protein [Facklamia sp. 253]QQD64794.1 ACP S-malonyltransferase [Aerococcaceae bacterium zg-252]
MKLAVIYNGQGAHFANMGLDFKDNFTAAKAVFDEATEITNYPIEQWIREDINQLAKTENAQVAIATTSLAIYRAIETELPSIEFMGGLSLGEYSALIASGMLSQAEGLALLKERGRLMSAHCEFIDDAQMAAVIGMPIDEIETLVTKIASYLPLYIANYNSPNQIVIAGTSQAIQTFKQAAKELGYKKVLPLKVEGPFHSPLMREVQAPFANVLQAVAFNSSDISVWSNVTVQPHQLETIKENLVKHLVEPVYWYQTIDKWVKDGLTHVIQIGPGDTLAKLLAGQHSQVKCQIINYVEDVDQLKEFLS